MSPETVKPKEKGLFSKIFDRLSQLEEVIRLVRKDTVSDTQATILVKLNPSYCTDDKKATRKNQQLKAYWKELLGPKTNFGSFTHREIGTVFIAGPLSQLFLHDLDGKKLAELSEGPYGILRGLGIDEVEATEHVKNLKEGRYLLLVRGPRFDINGLESALRGLDWAG